MIGNPFLNFVGEVDFVHSNVYDFEEKTIERRLNIINYASGFFSCIPKNQQVTN